jgi:hypothetical protein
LHRISATNDPSGAAFLSDHLLSLTPELTAMVQSELDESIHPTELQAIAWANSIDSVLHETIDYTIQKFGDLQDKAKLEPTDHHSQLGELAANVQPLLRTYKSEFWKIMRELSRDGEENMSEIA